MTAVDRMARGRLAAEILVFVAEERNVPLEVLMGRSRLGPYSEARALAAWGLRSSCYTLPYGTIGSLLGGRDHSTAIHLHQKAIALRCRKSRFALNCQRLLERFPHTPEVDHDHGSPCAV